MSKIPIIYEDENLVVFDKPCGIVVNKSETTQEETISEISSDYLQMGENDDIESDFYSRGGIVHRLDKNTSGVLLAAKNQEYFVYLQGLFKIRKVKKVYTAVSLGKMKQDEIVVTAPIARNPENRYRYAVVDGGKDARTEFTKIREIVKDDNTFTVIEARPLTGRTHQIRVHLSALNLPVLGDEIYLSKKNLLAYKSLFPRMMLHATELSFYDDWTKKEFVFKSPLPIEFNLS